MDSEAAPLPLRGHDGWAQGLDESVFTSAYKRSTIFGGTAVLLLAVYEQGAIALGLGCGVAVALFSTWTVEMMVRLLFRGGSFAGLKLALGACVKMPFLLAALLGIAWASFNGTMSVFAVVGGAMLMHGTLLATAVAAAVAQLDRKRQTAR